MKRTTLSRRGKIITALVAAAATMGGAGIATATPPVGATLVDRFDGKFLTPHDIRVNNVTDVVQQTLTIQPGGETGWHIHPGIVVLTVKSGQITRKNADWHCTVETFKAGDSFVKQGGIPLNGVNETNEPLVVELVYLKPEGTPLRYEREAPRHCNFD
ncbi:hypothetical protein BJP40_13850 [Streptomyces sp. CC53]|uniref:cupin domain-containing protein n=1 Tax=unclassified Streptomyces TaxID=2593676 RepID=UPI0008DDE8C3|nr:MULTISPECIES: cupin domain-containing protein [unclassified Streptomyces]OII66262.1 hypothetical protein BJP40_13850 [Streptomyces sp. CC53]